MVSRLLALAFALTLAAPAARGQLDLPDRRPPRRERPAEPPPAKPVPEPVVVERPEELDLPGVAAGDPTAVGAAARFVLDELRKVERVDDRLVRQAADSLLNMGAPGLAAAREALGSREGPLVLVGARVLLSAGLPGDRELVRLRVRGDVPRGVGGALVEEIAAVDPVLASPRLLVELADHAHTAVRAAATRLLEEQAGPDVLPLLAELADSRRTDARMRAVQLAEKVHGTEATSFLLSLLPDRSSRVSAEVVAALSMREDERLDTALLNQAFGRQWILREGAYAVLTLVEREDAQVRAILDGTHVDPLLQGLGSSDPFVAGTCAAALAGIGFREASADAPWLDRRVPHQLVRSVAGQEFHQDFSALRRAAVRRLTLITGQTFANDGPAWLEWWAESAASFRAHRASIEVGPADVGRLVVRCAERGPEQRTTGFTLIGPEAIWSLSAASAGLESDGQAAAPRLGETLYLSATQARDYVELLREEGVLGPERLPGTRGPRGAPGVSLEVHVGGRGKAFHCAESFQEPWLRRALEAARGLRERNRWQRYPDPERHATSLELWLEQAEWWEEAEPLERDQRLARLVLATLPARVPRDRQEGVDELTRLYAVEGVPAAADFPPLLNLLRDERSAGPRAHALVGLALEAGRSGELAPDGTLPAELARDLTAALDAGLGPGARPELERVVAAAGRPFAREVARDASPILRAVSAGVLARDPEPQDLELLRALLEDRDASVEVAAVRALGEHRVAALRDPLLVRARLGASEVRCAALVAAGRVGGENVLDALVVGLGDVTQPSVQKAAAEGLAELKDPTSAPLCVSLLRQGRDSALFEPTRAALLALGPAAWPDLLRVVNSPAHAARREAALILARQFVPQAASALLTLLTEEPRDREVAGELAVLTCVDFRSAEDPVEAWWAWWEQVVHDDANAWLCAALERAGLAAPVPAALASAGPYERARVNLRAIATGEPHVVERGRRGLSDVLGREVLLPPRGPEREAAAARLREEVEERWGGR